MSDPIFGDVLGAILMLARAAGSRTSHPSRRVPYCPRKSRTPTTRRRSLCSRRSRMRIMFLSRAVPLPRAPAQLLEHRASVTERRLKDRWNSSNSNIRGTRLQHILFSRTSIPRTFKLLYSDCLMRVLCWKTPHFATLLAHCDSLHGKV